MIQSSTSQRGGKKTSKGNPLSTFFCSDCLLLLWSSSCFPLKSQSHIKHEDYPDGVCRIIKRSQLHKDLLKANPDIKLLLTHMGCIHNQKFLLPFYSKYQFLFIKIHSSDHSVDPQLSRLLPGNLFIHPEFPVRATRKVRLTVNRGKIYLHCQKREPDALHYSYRVK